MDKIKKSLDKLQRYRHDSGLRDMVERKKGRWVLFEEAKSAICQAVSDYENSKLTRCKKWDGCQLKLGSAGCLPGCVYRE